MVNFKIKLIQSIDGGIVIRSSKHQIYTMELNKVSLSAYDDKRYILEDGISSYAYGNYQLHT